MSQSLSRRRSTVMGGGPAGTLSLEKRRGSVLNAQVLASTVNGISCAADVSSPITSFRTQSKVPNPLRIRSILLLTPVGVDGTHATPSSPSSASITADATLSASPATAALASKAQRTQRFEFDAICNPDDLFVSESSAMRCITEIQKEFLAGKNACIISIGTPNAPSTLLQSGTLSPLMGEESMSPFASNASSMVHSCVADIIRGLDEERCARGHSIELAVSMISFSSAKVKDLLAPVETACYSKPSISIHPLTGPRCLGMSQRVVTSIEEFSEALNHGRRCFAAEPQPSAVVLMYLTLKRLAPMSDVASGDFNLVMSQLLLVDAIERVSLMSKLADVAYSHVSPSASTTDLSALLQIAIGGSCLTAAIGNMRGEEDLFVATSLLTCLQKLSMISCCPTRVGDMPTLVDELKAQLDALRSRLPLQLEAMPRKRLEREITQKEHQLKEVELLILKAKNQMIPAAAVSRRSFSEFDRITQCGRLSESAAKGKFESMTPELRKRFADIFTACMSPSQGHTSSVSSRRAVGRDALPPLKLREFEAEVQGLKDAVRRERDKNQMLVNEKERMQHAKSKLEVLLDEERTQRTDLQSELQRLRKVFDETQNRLIVAETNLSEKSFHDTSRCSSQLHRISELEAELSSARASNSILFEKFHDVEFERNALSQQVSDLQRELQCKNNAQLEALEGECQHLRDRLVYRDDTIVELRGKVTSMQDQLDVANEAVIAAMQKNHLQESESCKKVATVRTKYEIERDCYLELVHEGRCYLDELRHFYTMDLRWGKAQSLYRGGREEVAAWLAQLGLEGLVSAFFQSGFDTMHAVSLITEDDLLQMKVICGSRRKILHSAKLVSDQFASCFTNSSSLFRHSGDSGGPSPLEQWNDTEVSEYFSRPTTLDAILSDLDAWMSDFRESLLTEVSCPN